MTEINHPAYYGILTANVRYNEQLSMSEKIMFSEITALSNTHGFCSARNKYFAKLYGKSEKTISIWIKHLKDYGFIQIEYERRGAEVISRKIYPIPEHELQKCNSTDNKNVSRTNYKNVKENNTSINNTSINNTTTEQLNKPKNVFEKYQIYVGMLNAIQTPVLSDYVQRLGDEVVSYAIDNMLDYTNKPNFKYLRKILSKYEQLGIDSVEKAKELDEKHSKKQEEIHQARNNRYVGRKPRQEKMPYWYHEKDNSEKKGETKSEKTETKSEIARLMQKINGDDEKNE